MPTAYSYLRFSSPQQAAGDSARRQVEKTADWCRRHNVELDNSMSLRDEGVSAFKGKHRENPDTHALAAFVNAVKAGRVPAGSYLVVESLDRLSREKIRPALTLLLNLIEAGVKVVQLMPVECVFDEDVEPMTLMMAVMELNRGHSESAVKSARVGAAWREKKKNAAGKVLTRMTPGWIRYDEATGKLALVAEKAATVRRVFALAREGFGVGRIAQKLNAEKVPLLGRTEFRGRPLVWSVNVVYGVLTNTATHGEYRPHTGSRGTERKPAGDPVPNYYPAVITEDEFHAVRGLLAGRASKGRGRRGRHVNLFAGLLKDARTGGSLTSKHYGNRSPVLVPVETRTTTGQPWASYGLKQFEEAVRAELVEVRVKDIAPESDPAAVRAESLAAQVEELKALAAKWQAKMDNPDLVDTVAAKLAEIEGKRKRLTAELAEAQQAAASPLSESWGQARAAGRALAEDDGDDARERYRSAVRRAVESIHVLVAPAKESQAFRCAAVQVWFKGGAHRDYVIGYRPARGRLPGELLRTLSFAESGIAEDGIDLRKPEDAALVDALLADLNPAEKKPKRKAAAKGK
jgi:DNA invertase Pin-like site-specific DNA recombinase